MLSSVASLQNMQKYFRIMIFNVSGRMSNLLFCKTAEDN